MKNISLRKGLCEYICFTDLNIASMSISASGNFSFSILSEGENIRASPFPERAFMIILILKAITL